MDYHNDEEHKGLLELGHLQETKSNDEPHKSEDDMDDTNHILGV